MKLFLLGFVIVSFLTGCPGFAPGSKFYSPPKDVEELFLRANKIAMPSDVLKQPEKYLGQEIHWIGILKGVKYLDEQTALIILDQKYWDYIEDYSIQTERIFLSPKGDGQFYLLFPFSKGKEFENFIKEAIAREDLMFVYGIFDKVENDLPLLKYTQGSFIHEKYYSTKIMEYDVKRDAEGNVVLNKNGLYEITNAKLLKIAGPGEND